MKLLRSTVGMIVGKISMQVSGPDNEDSQEQTRQQCEEKRCQLLFPKLMNVILLNKFAEN